MKLRCAKALALICACVLSCSVSGCSSEKVREGSIITMSEEEIKKDLSYAVVDIPIPEAVDIHFTSAVGSSMRVGRDMYFIRKIKKPLMPDGTAGMEINILAFDSNGIIYDTCITDSAAVGDDENLEDYCVAADNSVCALLSGKASKVVVISSDGRIAEKTDITEALSGSKAAGIAVLPDGSYAVENGRGRVMVISRDGELVFDEQIKGFPADPVATDIILTAKGDPAVSYAYLDMSDRVFKTEIIILDMKTKKFGKKTDIDGNGLAYTGNGTYNYYISSDTGIYGITDNGKAEKIVNLLNLGLDSFAVQSLYANDDGSLTLGIYDMTNATKDDVNGFVKIVPAADAGLTEKEIVTLGCFELGSTEQTLVSNFNRQSKDYLIVASSFSENNSDDRDAALIDFNYKLMNGDIPDIIMINSEMPFESYVRKGLFTDLYPYLDNDSDIGREDIFEGILRSGESDGKLYAITPSFYINTFAAKPDIIGDDKPLTMERAKYLVASMGEGGAISTDIDRSDALKNAVLYSGLIDFENSVCHFDTDEFRQLLTDLKDFPERIVPPEQGTPEYLEQQTSYMNGKTLITPYRSYQFLRHYHYRLLFDGDVSYVNFPTCMPVTNAVISPSNRFAVSEKSENKQGAWEFIKYALENTVSEFRLSYFNEQGDEVLVDDYEYYSFAGLPSYRKQYELLASTQLRDYHNYDEKGGLKETKRNEEFIGKEIEVEHLSEEELANFTELLENTTTVDRLNSSVMTIINDEAGAYFDGSADVYTASANIQSRMMIYLNE